MPNTPDTGSSLIYPESYHGSWRLAVSTPPWMTDDDDDDGDGDGEDGETLL